MARDEPRRVLEWRRERDSNPRGGISAYTISNRAPSAARTSLRTRWRVELHERARSSRRSLREADLFHELLVVPEQPLVIHLSVLPMPYGRHPDCEALPRGRDRG